MPPDSANPALNQLLLRQIDTHGPVSFKWYMEQVLYHPQFGYYSSGKASLGRRGDFFTNVSVGRIFGEMMAAQFEEMWLRLGKPMSFSIVEQGANDGQFANDVLNWLKVNSPKFFSVVSYWIVEPSSVLQLQQEANLSQWPRNKVRWHASLDEFEAGALCGVHFSNELLDSFPVHLVVHDGTQWEEVFVDATMKGTFRFVQGPISNGRLRDHLAKLPVPPQDSTPYRTEVNLKLLSWMEDVARLLRQGYVLAVDYGYPRAHYYAPGRLGGTLAVYHQHQRSNDPFEKIGECDLSAHVDFTSLAEVAEEHGLRLTGFCDQHHFLMGIGEQRLLQIEDHAVQHSGNLPIEMNETIRQFRTLMHPSSMGLAFKYIGFQKGVPADSEPLRGFKHCGDPRAELGLAPPVEQKRTSEYDSFYDPF